MHSKNRIPGKRSFGRGTDGIREERYTSVNFKTVVSYGPYNQRRIKNHRTKPCFFVGLQSGTVPPPSSASEIYSLRTKHEDVF